jgi:hypothetical protein
LRAVVDTVAVVTVAVADTVVITIVAAEAVDTVVITTVTVVVSVVLQAVDTVEIMIVIVVVESAVAVENEEIVHAVSADKTVHVVNKISA